METVRHAQSTDLVKAGQRLWHVASSPRPCGPDAFGGVLTSATILLVVVVTAARY